MTAKLVRRETIGGKFSSTVGMRKTTVLSIGDHKDRKKTTRKSVWFFYNIILVENARQFLESFTRKKRFTSFRLPISNRVKILDTTFFT